MKRRDFFTAATGISAATVLAGSATPALAQRRPAEKRAQVYRCTECKTIVEILVPGRPSLVHCGEPMELLEEQVANPAENKHVPVIEKIDGGYKVKVGSSAHPMTEDHNIGWIELIADGKIYRQFLNPGDKPEATFCIEAKEVSAREHCNLHGLWKDK
jgi:superoxide reductase